VATPRSSSRACPSCFVCRIGSRCSPGIRGPVR
jgi:hypothetical protein